MHASPFPSPCERSEWRGGVRGGGRPQAGSKCSPPTRLASLATLPATKPGLARVWRKIVRKSGRPYCVISLHCREYLAMGAAQHGHRGRYLTSPAIRRRRTVAIEFGMCRSGRNGGASGSITSGNGKLREEHGGGRS